MTFRPCLECGAPAENARCIEHAALKPGKASARERGYDTAWDRLSRRARRLQPFCLDCGATDDLQTDHSEEAWRRHERGLPIRLEDVDVVCGPCNRERGPARPRGDGVSEDASGPARQAKFASHTPGGIQ